MAPKEETFRGKKQADVLAELAAMRAAGEISSEELQAAREKILGPAGELPPMQVKTRVIPEGNPAKKKGGLGCGGTLLLLIVGAFVISGTVGPKTSPEVKAKSDAAATAKAAEDRRKGFHCLSAWDGSERHLVAAVKDNMREPSSFEHIETRITPIDSKGQHQVLMTYRGRNGFGGMNVERAIGVIDSSCSLLSVVTE